jgi:hypothetical protein
LADRATKRRVCIATPGYISSTPRVVREADALSTAGYDVRVVFTQGPIEPLRAFDRDLLQDRSWTAESFGWSSGREEERRANLVTGIRHRLFQALPASWASVPGAAVRAESRVGPELARLAEKEAADLFIGHYPGGLAAAAHAARRHNALLGYDVEDLYAETFPPDPSWRLARARILAIERQYVPSCAHISAVSAPVADAFRERFHPAAAPVVVHNCHPWAERAAMDGAVLDRRGPALSLFWFSQTVGLDRGLQDAIRAMGIAGVPMQLHLRGSVDADVRRQLIDLAGQCGVADRLHFQPPCPPASLLSRAAEHDVGLALETEASLNRRLTVTNKLFLYLTAGLAVAATDLPGQRSVLGPTPDAGALHLPGDVATLARQLAHWATDAGALARARCAALNAAEHRWNAEHESAHLVSAIEALLEGRR